MLVCVPLAIVFSACGSSADPNGETVKVAISDAGTFVAIKNEWQQWYDKQEFYRSRDGVSWEVNWTADFVRADEAATCVNGRPRSAPDLQ